MNNATRFFTKLTSVRALVTLCIIVTLCVVVLLGRAVPEAFAAVAATVLTFYFTRTDRKPPKDDDE